MWPAIAVKKEPHPKGQGVLSLVLLPEGTSYALGFLPSFLMGPGEPTAHEASAFLGCAGAKCHCAQQGYSQCDDRNLDVPAEIASLPGPELYLLYPHADVVHVVCFVVINSREEWIQTTDLGIVNCRALSG